MRLALSSPRRVSRLVVADIAPVAYPSHFGGYARAMAAVPRGHFPPGGGCDAGTRCAGTQPSAPSCYTNFRPGEGWRIGLPEIVASLPRIENWEDESRHYDGPVLVRDRGAIRLRIAGVSASDLAPVSGRPLRCGQGTPGTGCTRSSPAAFNATVGGVFWRDCGLDRNGGLNRLIYKAAG